MVSREMRVSCVVASVLGGVAAEAATAPDYEVQWEQFKAKYGKAYTRSPGGTLSGTDEEGERFAVFKSNLDFIRATNSQNLSFQLGVNEFADLTSEEFAATHTGFRTLWRGLPRLGVHEFSGGALLSEVDWTSEGKVTPVKNQGECGSCWAFSATGSLEGAWALATGTLVSLSEQQLVDCVEEDGCEGGAMDPAFEYAEQHAMCTEGSYGYVESAGSCRALSCAVGIPRGGVIGYKDVEADSDWALMEALAQQPVSIAIEADKLPFQLYISGVLQASGCGVKVDHGVLAVGFGSDQGVDYWKVKNSWGASWGEEGYVRVLRGSGGSGECGILTMSSYPVVSAQGAVIV
jgi:hypothetical protein